MGSYLLWMFHDGGVCGFHETLCYQGGETAKKRTTSHFYCGISCQCSSSKSGKKLFLVVDVV